MVVQRSLQGHDGSKQGAHHHTVSTAVLTATKLQGRRVALGKRPQLGREKSNLPLGRILPFHRNTPKIALVFCDMLPPI